MPNLILTIGISASGKSTWAEAYCRNNGAVNINRDDLRFSLSGFRTWSCYKFKKPFEALITRVQEAIAREAVSTKSDIVISDTNLNPSYHVKWHNFAVENGYTLKKEFFDTSVEECIKRDTQRANGVGAAVIHQQYAKWLDLRGHKKHQHEEGLPSCIIVDVDGTLDRMGNRGPFDWEVDTVDAVVRQITNSLGGRVDTVFLLSGRDEVCRAETELWLKANDVRYDHLEMRPKGSYEKDTIIKKRMFDNLIDGKYNVLAVLDGRPCAVNMWNGMGLKVLAVADQRIEF